LKVADARVFYFVPPRLFLGLGSHPGCRNALELQPLLFLSPCFLTLNFPLASTPPCSAPPRRAGSDPVQPFPHTRALGICRDLLVPRSPPPLPCVCSVFVFLSILFSCTSYSPLVLPVSPQTGPSSFRQEMRDVVQMCPTVLFSCLAWRL